MAKNNKEKSAPESDTSSSIVLSDKNSSSASDADPNKIIEQKTIQGYEITSKRFQDEVIKIAQGQIKEQIDELKEKDLKNLQKEIADSRLKIVESLAIFGLFIVFVTSGLQVLIRVSDLSSIIVILISIFGLTTILFLSIDAAITNNNRVQPKDKKEIKLISKQWAKWFTEYVGHKTIILILISLFLILFSLWLAFTKDKPLNPVKGNLEFEDSLDKKIDDRINQEIENSNAFRILNNKINYLNKK